MIGEINYILNVMKEYFQQLLDSNQNIGSDTSNTHRNRSEGEKCEMEEVQEYMEIKKKSTWEWCYTIQIIDGGRRGNVNNSASNTDPGMGGRKQTR